MDRHIYRNEGINISDNGKEERKVGRYTAASKQARKKEREKEGKYILPYFYFAISLNILQINE